MKRQTVAMKKSDYGEYRIIDMRYDDRPARLLYGAQSSPQSGVALDDEPELLFDYNQRFMEMLYTTQPKRLLVLGGGVLTLPMALARQFPEATIDVVEIDPLLPVLAEEFFGFISTDRLRVIIDDAVRFMVAHHEQYDAIIIDVFDGRRVVSELFTQEMAARYLAHLLPGGVVLVNVISRYKTRRTTLVKVMFQDFQRVFTDVSVYPADPAMPARAEQNLIVVAAQAPRAYDYVQSEPVMVSA